MRPTTTKGTVLIGMLVLCGGLATDDALARAPEASTASVSVTYGDLDLNQHEHAEKLYSRITAAARRVCGWADPRDLSRRQVMDKCRNQAIANAVEQIDRPVLTALHRSKAQRRIGSA